MYATTSINGFMDYPCADLFASIECDFRMPDGGGDEALLAFYFLQNGINTDGALERGWTLQAPIIGGNFGNAGITVSAEFQPDPPPYWNSRSTIVTQGPGFGTPYDDGGWHHVRIVVAYDHSSVDLIVGNTDDWWSWSVMLDGQLHTQAMAGAVTTDGGPIPRFTSLTETAIFGSNNILDIDNLQMGGSPVVDFEDGTLGVFAPPKPDPSWHVQAAVWHIQVP